MTYNSYIPQYIVYWGIIFIYRSYWLILVILMCNVKDVRQVRQIRQVLKS